MTVETVAAAPVRVTPRAAKHIAGILEQETGQTHLRVSVLGGGCSGFQYEFRLDASRDEGDLVIAEGGAVVAIDPVSLEYLKGSEIDFVDEMIGASFKIKNPNATSSCGCGTSFSV